MYGNRLTESMDFDGDGTGEMLLNEYAYTYNSDNSIATKTHSNP